MKYFIYLIIALTVFAADLHAQEEYHNWIFGEYAGITFFTPDGEPEAITSRSEIMETSSSISNEDGNLLFYTFGDELVIEENAAVLNDKNKFDGDVSSTQGVILLKINKNKFIRIGANIIQEEHFKPEYRRTLSYVIIERDDNGQYSVGDKKVILNNYNAENILVVKDHRSETFYLILNDREEYVYYLYKYDLLDDEFNKLQEIESSFDLKEEDFDDYMIKGYFKSSPSGKYLASVWNDYGIEFLKLNVFKEELEILQKYEETDLKFNSGEFSPNGRNFYYLGRSKGMNVLTTSNNLETSTLKLKTLNPDMINIDRYSMKLGPNGKIYITNNHQRYLSAIENPNDINNYNFVEESVELTGKGRLGLPNTASKYYLEFNVEDTLTFCEGENAQLEFELSEESSDYQTNWSGPNGFSSSEKSPVIENITKNMAGKYIVKISSKGVNLEDSIFVKIVDAPEFNITSDKPLALCSGDSLRLYVEPYNEAYEYKWSNGATGREIFVEEPDVYSVTVSLNEGCRGTDTVEVKRGENIIAEISGSDICENGEAVTLLVSPKGEEYEYSWEHGDVGDEIEVNEPGTYVVTVSKDNCFGIDSFEVKELPAPEFEVLGEKVVCIGDSTTLSSSKDFPDYIWSTGDTTKNIKVAAGEYWLEVTDGNGCTNRVDVNVNETNLDVELASDIYQLGKVYLSDGKDTTISITNNSEFDITVEFLGEEIVIPTGEHFLDYNFSAANTGERQVTESIRVTKPCEDEFEITIIAEVYARVKVFSEDIHTQISENETVPVYMQAFTDLPEKTFTLNMNIDEAIFFPEQSYAATFTETISTEPKNIYNVDGQILLAKFDAYSITFPEMDFEDEYIEWSSDTSYITFDSICIHDQRVVKTHAPTEIESSPMPTNDVINITIATGERGIFDLKLISIEGKTIYSTNWEQSSDNKSLQIETSEIPPGVYHIILKTEAHLYKKDIIVVE